MIHGWIRRAGDAWLTLSPSRRRVVACVLWGAATVPILSRLVHGGPSNDLVVYMRGADALIHGPRLYAEVSFEYPPYSLIWFLVPRAVADDLASFRLAFGLEIWMFDAAIKAVLLLYGLRTSQGLRGLAPFLAYSVGGAALGYVLLQRFDLVPAALSLAAVLTLASGRTFASGLLVVVAAGTKLYPILFIPLLAAFAWQRGSGHLRRFTAGAALGALPLAAAAAWAPWWRFASFHLGRGLQVESLLASFIWALHHAGLPAGWERAETSHALTGPVADALLAPGRLLCALVTLACLASAILTASHGRQRARRSAMLAPAAGIAAVLLLPVAAFVATNTVLSPQFHLWLLPLSALVLSAHSAAPAAPDRRPLPAAALRGALCVSIAPLIVPVFYPTADYATGLNIWRTTALLLRNGLLVYATWCLWVAVRAMRRPDASVSVAVGSGRQDDRQAGYSRPM